MAVYDVNGNEISGGGSSTIQDKSVTPPKTTFFDEEDTYTFINCGTIESGLIGTNGSNSSNSSYKRTAGYISYSSGSLYSVTYGGYLTRVCCYNSAKTFISEASTESYSNTWKDSDGNTCYHRVYTTPSNTAYIRFTFPTTVSETFYLSASEIPSGFDPESTDFTILDDYPQKMWDALNIPNLDVFSRFKGKKMIVAGDSITEKNTTSSKVWSEWLAEWLGVKVYNDGQGGTGFAKDYMYRGATLYRIENNWASLYPAEPDIILVMGNQNDGTGGGGGYTATYPSAIGASKLPVGTISDASTTFSEYGVMRRLLEDLTTLYPKAKIGVISSTPRDVNLTDQWSSKPKSYGLGWYHDYVTAQKEVCADFGVPFLDIYHQNPVLRPYVSANATEYYWDGSSVEVGEPTGSVHPNEKGHLEGIARPVLEWMLEWC